MKIIAIIGSLVLAFLYWLGLSINHLVILFLFISSIFVGSLVIADTDEKEENIS